MKVLKTQSQTNKKSMKLTKNRNDGAGAPGGSFCIFQHPLLQNIKKLKGEKNW